MLRHWHELHLFVRYSFLRVQLHSHNILQHFNFPESEISDPKNLVYHRNMRKPWGFPPHLAKKWVNVAEVEETTPQ